MVKRPDSISKRIIDAAFELAAETGWRRVSLGDIAARASVTLAELAEHFSSKGAILIGFTRQIDAEVLANLDEETAEESPRDRLFGVIMKRFDALMPYKAGLAAILRAPDGDVASFAAGACRYVGSMGLMLEAAGVSTAGFHGRLRVQGLAAIYPTVLRTWLNEDAADMPRTMAALDRWLRRAEAADQWLCRRPSYRREEPPEPEAPEPEPARPRRARRRGRRTGRGGASASA
jgi:AcrR family transcriptional regulator